MHSRGTPGAAGEEARDVVANAPASAQGPAGRASGSGSPFELILCDVELPDVRGAWAVRDEKFNAMICGKGLLEVCARDRIPPAAVIKAMNSKGSVKFGLGMQKGRMEGAKEQLGTLSM